MSLERELATYRRLLPGLIPAHEGRWVVVSGERILPESYGDYEAALAAGYEAFGPGAWLAKRVERVETVHWFGRDV